MRLILDHAHNGAVNMALDEAVLVNVGQGDSPATLRLYRWRRPTISLGYFQKYADFAALSSPAGTLPVVRRLTGGGAILHDLELTYSLVLPAGHALLADGSTALYERAHAAVIEALAAEGLRAKPAGFSDDSSASRGPFFCFARRHRLDVVVGDGKIAGSAQRRTPHAVLQHGSIILANRFAEQPVAAPTLDRNPNRASDRAFASRLDRVRTEFVRSFAAGNAVELTAGSWSADELRTARELRQKYAGAEWTRRR